MPQMAKRINQLSISSTFSTKPQSLCTEPWKKRLEAILDGLDVSVENCPVVCSLRYTFCLTLLSSRVRGHTTWGGCYDGCHRRYRWQDGSGMLMRRGAGGVNTSGPLPLSLPCYLVWGNCGWGYGLWVGISVEGWGLKGGVGNSHELDFECYPERLLIQNFQMWDVYGVTLSYNDLSVS